MIVVLKRDISDSEKQYISQFLSGHGFKVREISEENRTIIGAVGPMSIDSREIKILPGVAEVVPISKPYKMASRELHRADSIIGIGPVKIGGSRIVIIAGPCAVESMEQISKAAWAVKEAGGVMLRGGAFKPRTSPYAFQGLGEKGLEYLKAAGQETGLPTVSEVVSPNAVKVMAEFIDVFQIGARNMQNFELLKAVGATGMPVILKRGLAATIEEWLMAAEYLLASGTDDVILCERGIRTFGRETRNTLDISAIPVVRELTHLPVIVDPSHATGIRDKVPSMALASVAAGAHGLIIEVHPNPDMAVSDGAQSLWPTQFSKLLRDIEALCPTVGKEMARLPERHQQDVQRSRLGKRKGGGESAVVFQGEHGANSEKAIQNYFPEGEVVPMPAISFEDIFDAVLSQDAAWGMVPIENSLTGSILENYDLLARFPDVKIVGEIKIRVEHSLIVLPGSEETGIKEVYSHPQALSQCARFLKEEKRKNWKVMPFFDTAGAAAMIAREKNVSLAAIAGAEAAAYHGLKVLYTGIETNPHNYTRFVVIAHADTPNPENSDKVSFRVTLKSHPGSLADCLSILKNHDVDMTKLESRPIEGTPWKYQFYIDARLPGTPEDFEAVEEELAEATDSYCCLGIYRAC
ncbi:MAG: 3-deoxy-7-phosphoheptulonate synthase [spirochete symbiont of Stewartia floridana]|nr:MAG: 3-deoxy-7-phosphoheptulonate synthase [spirochete symbiont of Stewartia floridana]